MKTDVSLYHRVYDETTQTDKYEIKHLYNVSWQGGKGASIDKGYVESNDIKLRIFYKDNPGLETVTFSIGDFVIKGISTKKVNRQSELEETYNITTIIPHKRGSIVTKHIQIGAK